MTLTSGLEDSEHCSLLEQSGGKGQVSDGDDKVDLSHVEFEVPPSSHASLCKREIKILSSCGV